MEIPGQSPPSHSQDKRITVVLFHQFLWNPGEHRLRAVWRLTLQIFLYLLIAVFIAAGLAIAAPVSGLSNNLSPSQDPSGYIIISILSPILTLFGITASVWAAGKWFDHRKFTDFGIHLNRRFWLDLGFGLILGAFLMTFIFLIELSAGWIRVTGTLQSTLTGVTFGLGLLQSIILFLCVGVYEELFSRGFQLRNLAEGLNFPALGSRWALVGGWVLSSLIFGLLHAANPNASIISTLNIFVAGLFLGLGTILTGELAIPIGIHITWNFFQGNVFGFPVSGTTPIVSVISIQQAGPEILTGAAFGPEAGILGLLAMVIGSLLTLLWVRHYQKRITLKESLAFYQNT